MTIVSLVGGALADRFSKKYLIIISQTANAVMTFVLAMMDASGAIWFGAVLIIGVVNGAMMAINMPSRQAIISDIVPESRLMNAVALNNSAMNLTRIIGPLWRGFLIIFIQTSGRLHLISIIYVFSALSLLMVRVDTAQSKSAKKSVGKDIVEGLRYVWNDVNLRGLILMAFIPSLFGFTLFALLPVWAREALNVNSSDLGILMTMMGVGALIGTLGLAAIRRFSHRGLLLLGCGIVWGIMLVGLANSQIYPVAMPFLLIIGLISSVYMSLNMTLTQLSGGPRNARPRDEHNDDDIRANAHRRAALRHNRGIHRHRQRAHHQRRAARVAHTRIRLGVPGVSAHILARRVRNAACAHPLPTSPPFALPPPLR